MNPATLMFTEAGQAADVAARQLEHNDVAVRALASSLRQQPPRLIATCARGSSDHAATFAKYLLETRTGIATTSVSPSVGSVYSVPLHLRDSLFLAISQSGRSPDLLENARRARQAGARVVAVVNAEDSPLAALAHSVIPVLAGPERSVAATKSFIGTLFALSHLAAHWSAEAKLLDALRGLPVALHEAFALDWSALAAGLQPAHNMFVLGRGLGYGGAQEAALKFKETCALHAEAFSTAEVRHGPMALIGPDFPLLLLGQRDRTLADALETAALFRAHGARVWTALPGDDHPDALPIVAAAHPACAPMLVIQSLYRAIESLSRARGLDPDRPPHLNKVTETV